MYFLFLDDSKVRSCSRPRMGDLVGVGGVCVHSAQLRNLEVALEDRCRAAGFPSGEVFKWSPARNHWMRDSLTGTERIDFINSILVASMDHEAIFLAAVNDSNAAFASSSSESHELDALTLVLERFNTFLRSKQSTGVAIVAKPSGGNSEERGLLSHCVELRESGTGFVKFERLALNVMVANFNHSRVLQAADLIISITTTMVAGLDDYAKFSFPKVAAGFLESRYGQKGGTGLKIHPSKYTNLYHWLLGDDYRVTGNVGAPLPITTLPFAIDGMRY